MRQTLSSTLMAALLSLPIDGSWVAASGPGASHLNELLDGGSLLIEEEDLLEDDHCIWRVRLTSVGVDALRDVLAERGPTADKDGAEDSVAPVTSLSSPA